MVKEHTVPIHMYIFRFGSKPPHLDTAHTMEKRNHRTGIIVLGKLSEDKACNAYT